jgi:hypothetical protein
MWCVPLRMCCRSLSPYREVSHEGINSALAERVRAGLAALGIDSLQPAEQSSVVLRACRLPPDIDRLLQCCARLPR